LGEAEGAAVCAASGYVESNMSTENAKPSRIIFVIEASPYAKPDRSKKVAWENGKLSSGDEPVAPDASSGRPHKRGPRHRRRAKKELVKPQDGSALHRYNSLVVHDLRRIRSLSERRRARTSRNEEFRRQH